MSLLGVKAEFWHHQQTCHRRLSILGKRFFKIQSCTAARTSETYLSTWRYTYIVFIYILSVRVSIFQSTYPNSIMGRVKRCQLIRDVVVSTELNTHRSNADPSSSRCLDNPRADPLSTARNTWERNVTGRSGESSTTRWGEKSGVIKFIILDCVLFSPDAFKLRQKRFKEIAETKKV